MKVCIRCFISGQVQGVFFRASTRHEAEQLSVTGYVKNLSDGRVEVLACGTKVSIDNLCAWLAKGPPHAEVNNVSCEVVADEPPACFSIE